MKWLRRKKVLRQENGVPLVVADMEDEPLWMVPNEIIENLRYMITKVGRTAPIPSRLALVAAQRGEGVTYLSRALGAVMVHDLGVSVAVVHLNWWWPAPFPEFNPAVLGLADVLLHDEPLENVMVKTGWHDLTVIPSGELPLSQRPVIARSQALAALIEQLEERFDHLLLDVPAVLATNDAVPLASLADSGCLIVRQETTTIEQARLALDEIKPLPLLGVVMNRVDTATPSWLLKLIPQT